MQKKTQDALVKHPTRKNYIFYFTDLSEDFLAAAEWHFPHIAHDEQLHPQDDLPFFLSFTIPTIIRTTTAMSIAPTSNPPQLFANHSNITLLL